MSPQPQGVFHELVSKAEALVSAFQQTYREPPAAIAGPALAAMIDHTILKPGERPRPMWPSCAKSRRARHLGVCVMPGWVRRAVRRLEGRTMVVSVAGFPLGSTTTAVKVAEACGALDAGATEIDMVINVGMLKGGEYAFVHDDIAAVADVCHGSGAILKVIIEAVLLSDVEKALACALIVRAGADFAKTSTGFSTGGATARDVALMRAAVGPELGVKAAGGIRTYEAAALMVAAGATRIGASSSIKIVQGAPA